MKPETTRNTKSKHRDTPAYSWVILTVVYLASVAAPLHQMKVPPLIPLLMDEFQISLSQAGMLMSVFAVTGLFLALPTGLILQKIGPKITGLIALASLSLGAIVGALAESIEQLITGRVIEGIGMGLIAVVAPATIAMWFPSEKQGAPMGIWATWVPLGSLTMLMFAPMLAESWGWQMVWWIDVAFTLVIMLFYALLVRTPEVDLKNTATRTALNFRQALANRDIWLLGLTFACFTFSFSSFGTFYPTFLAEVRAYPLAQASRIYSIVTILILFSAPLAGWISDKIGSRRLVFAIPFLVIAVLMLFPFRVIGWQIYAYLVVLGLIAGAIPTATFSAAPDVMGKPEWAGLGMGVVMLGQNLGMVIGPILIGGWVERFDWIMAGYLLIPICLLGFLAGWNVRVR